jgi:RecA-family ATPase
METPPARPDQLMLEGPQRDKQPRFALTRLSDVPPERIEWLWDGYLPRGKIVILDGDPGLGKSSVAIDLAARISRGWSMPPSAPTPLGPTGNVFILTSEDGLADTVRPRLDAAGADTDMIYSFAVPGRLVTFPDDVPVLGQAIAQRAVRLVIVDPLMGFTSGSKRANHGQDMRQVLRPVAEIAEVTGATVVLVRHLRKGDAAKALYRGGGAIDIIGQARVGLAVAEDPSDPERRLLTMTKNNLAKASPTLAYRLVEASGTGAARVEWDLAPSTYTADDLLAERGTSNRPSRSYRPDPLRESAAKVHGWLLDGPRKARDCLTELQALGLPAPESGRDAGKLKAYAGFEHKKVGNRSGSYVEWYLPAEEEIV